MFKICLAFLLFFCVTTSVYSQGKVDDVEFECNPRFRSVQIDASSCLLIDKIGASVDFDIFESNKINKSDILTFGLRVGAEKIWASKWESLTEGSPFTQFNGYIRSSLEGKIVRFDVYAGGAYQIATKSPYAWNYWNKDMMMLKAGFDFKIKIIPYAGIMLNGGFSPGQSFGGLGVYVSYK